MLDPYEGFFSGKDAIDAAVHILSDPKRRARIEQLIFSISKDNIQLYVNVRDARILAAPSTEDDPIAPLQPLGSLEAEEPVTDRLVCDGD